MRWGAVKGELIVLDPIEHLKKVGIPGKVEKFSPQLSERGRKFDWIQFVGPRSRFSKFIDGFLYISA